MSPLERMRRAVRYGVPYEMIRARGGQPPPKLTREQHARLLALATAEEEQRKERLRARRVKRTDNPCPCGVRAVDAEGVAIFPAPSQLP